MRTITRGIREERDQQKVMPVFPFLTMSIKKNTENKKENFSEKYLQLEYPGFLLMIKELIVATPH